MAGLGSVSLTGQDSIILGQNGLAPRILADLADGDTAMLEFPNNIVEAKVGKDGNTIYAFNATTHLTNWPSTSGSIDVCRYIAATDTVPAQRWTRYFVSRPPNSGSWPYFVMS